MNVQDRKYTFSGHNLKFNDFKLITVTVSPQCNIVIELHGKS